MHPSARAVACAAIFSVGCGLADGRQDISGEGAAAETEVLPETIALDQDFAEAGAAFDVPVALLKSIAWVETGWHMVAGEDEFDAGSRRFGIMGLDERVLDEAAALAGEDPDSVTTDLGANVRAAAALLSSYADEAQIDRTDLASWGGPTARYSNIELEDARGAYVHEEVYRVLRYGLTTEVGAFAPVEVYPDYPHAQAAATPGPDYSAAVWRPSPNHSARPSGTTGKPQMVIIHTCEGSYSGCWGWLANSASGVSAHYVVNSDGSELTQLVRENRKAWHIAASYKASLNGGVASNLEGVSSNNFTVGIEHAGYGSQASWSEGLLSASAKLTCNITADNGIARDEWHIVGHGKLQPYNRTDPGPNWPWASYLSRVNTACGGGTPEEPEEPVEPPPSGDGTIIVDSNQAANGANASFEASANWSSSTSISGYYNTGYFVRSTGESSDLASFKAYLPMAKQMIVEAWWPASSNRSPSAPFIIYNGAGQQLDVKYVDQRANGGQWVTLGTYSLTAGWNVVALSRWTAPGSVVVADAVRFREAP